MRASSARYLARSLTRLSADPFPLLMAIFDVVVYSPRIMATVLAMNSEMAGLMAI